MSAKCEFCEKKATLLSEEYFHDGCEVIQSVVTCDEHAWHSGKGPMGRWVNVMPIDGLSREEIKGFLDKAVTVTRKKWL